MPDYTDAPWSAKEFEQMNGHHAEHGAESHDHEHAVEGKKGAH
jgi:hypothetical protein